MLLLNEVGRPPTSALTRTTTGNKQQDWLYLCLTNQEKPRGDQIIAAERSVPRAITGNSTTAQPKTPIAAAAAVSQMGTLRNCVSFLGVFAFSLQNVFLQNKSHELGDAILYARF